MTPGHAPGVTLVTARTLLSPNARTQAEEVIALERWLDEAIAARVDVIQVRERDLSPVVLGPLVSRLVTRTRGTATLVLVNDRADVAMVTAADGVHLRADGPGVERVRSLRPPPWIVGRSIHTRHEASTYGAADYLLFGTVFPGGSKPPAAPAAGVEGLAAAVAVSRAPVLAIGGITPERARRCLRAGAAGVAAIGLFLPEGLAPGALGAARAVRELRAAIDDEQRQE